VSRTPWLPRRTEAREHVSQGVTAAIIVAVLEGRFRAFG
jgi:hypothetical protein